MNQDVKMSPATRDFYIKQIRDAYVRIRQIDHTIPDDILDLMRDAAIQHIKDNSI